MSLPKLSSLRPKRSLVLLLVALGAGLLAAFGAYRYLTEQAVAIAERARGKSMALVVAKRDLRRGDRISGDTVAVREIPADYAHSGAMTPAEFDRAEGQTLAYPLRSGEMVLWSLLETKRAPSFSARIEAGRRAITVPVDEISSISGMLEPGDMIDLMVSLERKGRHLALPLLQGVRVLATGQKAQDDGKGGERRAFATVTLDATPAEAESVILAREAGRLTALLRNPQDPRPQAAFRSDLKALLSGSAGGDEAERVPVLYGGRGAKASPDTPSMRLPLSAPEALK